MSTKVSFISCLSHLAYLTLVCVTICRGKKQVTSQTEAPTRQLQSSSRLNIDTQTEQETAHEQLNETGGI